MKKGSIVSGFSDRVDLSDESLPACPLIEICGYGRVLLEHHKGVIEYSETQISVRVGYGTVRICGANLRICRMTEFQLVISGRIESIILDRR